MLSFARPTSILAIYIWQSVLSYKIINAQIPSLNQIHETYHDSRIKYIPMKSTQEYNGAAVPHHESSSPGHHFEPTINAPYGNHQLDIVMTIPPDASWSHDNHHDNTAYIPSVETSILPMDDLMRNFIDHMAIEHQKQQSQEAYHHKHIGSYKKIHDMSNIMKILQSLKHKKEQILEHKIRPKLHDTVAILELVRLSVELWKIIIEKEDKPHLYDILGYIIRKLMRKCPNGNCVDNKVHETDPGRVLTKLVLNQKTRLSLEDIIQIVSDAPKRTMMKKPST